MTFQILSDVHTEFYSNMKVFPYPKVLASYLILAGDIGDPYHKNYIQFLTWCAEKYTKVFLITGNHEYYRESVHKHSIDQTNKRIRVICKGWPNVHFLETSSYVLKTDNGKIAILGTTLWSKIPIDDFTYAQDHMNDYHKIYKNDNTNVDPEFISNLHDKEFAWLKSKIEYYNIVDDVDCIIVVTHHAPSLRMISPTFLGDRSNVCYATELDQFIEKESHHKLRVWFNGHTHHSCIVNIGKAKLISNCLGYPILQAVNRVILQKTGFDPNKVIRLAT
jgi:predicted phosphodiesterase